jgi:nucleolar protein 56
MKARKKANRTNFEAVKKHDFRKQNESKKTSENFANFELSSSDAKIKIYNINELIPSKYKSMEDFKSKIKEKCLKDSIKKVKAGINEQDLIGIYVSYIDILDEIINSYFERASEHLTIYYPEASLKAEKLEDFSKIKSLKRKDLAKLFGVFEESMGFDLSQKDLEILDSSIVLMNSLIAQKTVFENRIKEMAKELMRNTSALAGEIVAAKLLAAAGNLKRLMLMPSSTIQVLGAEKALFRHLRSKAKPPKHGLIFNTTYVSSAPLNHRGKIARALASKIAIAVKMDYFKGKDISQELIDDLNKKIGGLKK